MAARREHMAQKRDVAVRLLACGVLDVFVRQLVFWATEWQGGYGDC